MGAEELNSFARSSYDYGFRRDAHQLLVWGYQHALPEIYCNLQEEEITGLIVEAIEKRLDNQGKRKKTIEKLCYVARPAARTVSI
jgi:hypothetical protein